MQSRTLHHHYAFRMIHGEFIEAGAAFVTLSVHVVQDQEYKIRVHVDERTQPCTCACVCMY